MIITKKVRRKVAHKNNVIEYNIEYIGENPQKYINKNIKTNQQRNELSVNDGYRTVDYNAHNDDCNYPIERTKEEIIMAINYMLEQERLRMVEEEQNNCLSLKKTFHRF